MFAPFKIQVPATSANLGPGFDVLGLGIKLYNEFAAIPAEELALSISPNSTIDMSGVSTNPQENLVTKSYAHYFQALDLPIVPANLAIKANIPLARGLGSSSSAIVGGLFLANEVNNRALSKKKLLQMAIEIEGHPDNVSPAMMGGVQYCLADNTSMSLNWPNSWELVFVIPPTPLETKKSRSVLPLKYSEYQIEASQRSLLSWIIAVQTSDIQKMKKALSSDVLHEPYRRTLIPEYGVVSNIIKHSHAMGAVISGAGSALLIITHGNVLADTMERLKRESKLTHCQIVHLGLDIEGAKLI